MLNKRSDHPELMDDLTLSGEELQKNLEELEVINTWLGGYQVVLRALDKLIAEHNPLPKKLHIADIGCGGGDTLRSIAKWAKHKGIHVQLTGIDANDFMVQYARQRCCHYSGVEIRQYDVFSKHFAQEKYDVVVCSLFCHHFRDAQLTTMFEQLYNQANLAVIINDLHRHWLAYYAIKYITAAFSGSRLVKNDAPLSVWRGFKRHELIRLVEKAGISKYKLCWMWAFRWQLVLRKV